MKSINNYISEKLVINKDTKLYYNYFPKRKKELQEIIKQRIAEEGNECNLNDIDVSEIKSMSFLFEFSDFNGDISKWDVSNVKDMRGMFTASKFNGDISKWDVSKVNDMTHMFYYAKFNKDISSWNVHNNCKTYEMFVGTSLYKKEKEWWKKTK